MKIADGVKVADVNVKFNDVTWKLGERVDVQTRGTFNIIFAFIFPRW